jgi:hypothetical protein
MQKYFIYANRIKFQNYDEKYNYILHIYISIKHNDIFRLNIHVFFLSFLKNVHVHSLWAQKGSFLVKYTCIFYKNLREYTCIFK